MATAIDTDLMEVIRLIPGYDPVATAPEECWFDDDAARRALDFFPECLRHPKDSVGALAGAPFALEPWEQAIIANTFGWKRADGLRRYRVVFLGVGRKNGKTCLGAGLGIYMVFCDGEQGAEAYSLAEDGKQAGIIWDMAAGMIRQEPMLKDRCVVYGDTVAGQHKALQLKDRSAFWEVLTRNSETKHGLNPHVVLGDELHAMSSPKLMDTMETAFGSRRQPLMFLMTTSDYDRESVCNEKWDYAERVRDGILEDSEFLPVIYAADKGDDWEDREVWKKANPNLGVSKSLDYMEAQFRKAKAIPRFQNEFKRLHLNMRTGQASVWIMMEDWDACKSAIDWAALKGHRCYAGLDLSSTRDTTALVLVFPDDGNALLPFCWVPDEMAQERERAGEAPYYTWSQQGLMELTPGNAIDLRYIRHRLDEIRKEYDLLSVGFDPYGARLFAQQLQDEDGWPMIEFQQGWQSMNEPSKAFEALILRRELRHDGHPVLRWQVSNLATTPNPTDNVKPDKGRSGDKIDLVVGAVMAVGLAMAPGGDTGSVYETDERAEGLLYV